MLENGSVVVESIVVVQGSEKHCSEFSRYAFSISFSQDSFLYLLPYNK